MKGIYLVTDQKAARGKPLEQVVSDAVKAGVSCVQLREKHTDTRQFLERAQQFLTILKPAGVPLIINDRVDIAQAAGADGVHIGQSDMPYEDARKLLGPEAIIGLSVETWEDVEQAESMDVAYIGVSPVFATPTKTDTKSPWGINGLEKIKQFSRHPLVAIGGLDAANSEMVINAGADSIAVVSAICSAANCYEAARDLVGLFNNTYT